MERLIKFSALACGGCEGIKPIDEVVWTINYWYKNGQKRGVGFLLGSEVSAYSDKEKVFITRSSAVCPQCAANVVTEGSLDTLRIRWSKEMWIEGWINRYLSFMNRTKNM